LDHDADFEWSVNRQASCWCDQPERASVGAGAEGLSGMGGDVADSLLGCDTALGEAGADYVNGQKSRDTIAGGGNGVPADVGDTLVGPERERDELFAFEPALGWRDGV
jgi:hypothetical protein